MSILKKTVFAQNLDRYNAFLTDTDTNSRYFRVTQIPDVFTGGKNGFLIQGSTELAKDSYLMIEIKDANGDTIYYEPAFGGRIIMKVLQNLLLYIFIPIPHLAHVQLLY